MGKHIVWIAAILLSLINLSCREKAGERTAPINDDYWSEDRIKTAGEMYNIHDNGPEKYHFPRNGFLASGYCPEGGYVKDFSIIFSNGRWHLFHIDGRPGETCWITGNEISFGHASTTDFDHWMRHNMPLAIGDRDWENKHIWAPFVFKNDSAYLMYYNAQGSSGNSNISIAYSDNLDNWVKTGALIEQAPGRDPFVFEHNEQTILLYTYENKIGACSSADLKTWVKLEDVITIPEGAPESCSVHKLGDRFLLWFNGWNIYGDTKMYSFYAFSDSILDFTNSEYKQIQFEFEEEFAEVNKDFIINPNNICPISIEKIAGNDELFFVCYFRPQIDRFKLFFGEMDLTREPITIREINNKQELDLFLEKIDISYKNSEY